MKILSTILIAFLSFSLFAQTETGIIQEELLNDWKRAKEYTLKYIEAMPEEKIEFRPVEGIRSFAEQMLHLSQGTIGLVSNGTGKEKIYGTTNLEKADELKNKEDLKRIVTESYDFAISAIQEFDMSTSGEVITRGPFNVTRLGWIKKAFEHQTHHRGQCTIYLRMAGVTPPEEMLF